VLYQPDPSFPGGESVLAVGTKEVKVEGEVHKVRISLNGLGRNFIVFLVIVGIFDLGNSSDAFLVLRAQERGMSALNILIMLAAFNLIYTVISTPAGALSDKLAGADSSSAAGLSMP
jgi:hypothetical protein